MHGHGSASQAIPRYQVGYFALLMLFIYKRLVFF